MAHQPSAIALAPEPSTTGSYLLALSGPFAAFPLVSLLTSLATPAPDLIAYMSGMGAALVIVIIAFVWQAVRDPAWLGQ